MACPGLSLARVEMQTEIGPMSAPTFVPFAPHGLASAWGSAVAVGDHPVSMIFVVFGEVLDQFVTGEMATLGSASVPGSTLTFCDTPRRPRCSRLIGSTVQKRPRACCRHFGHRIVGQPCQSCRGMDSYRSSSQ